MALISPYFFLCTLNRILWHLKIKKMSSNFTVDKICEHCKNVFSARTIKTRYCSHLCNSRNYKFLKRQKKIKVVEEETKVNTMPLEDVRSKDFLSVKEASSILNMSTRTIYRLIENKELNSYNFSVRKTLIRRKDIDYYFDLNLNNSDENNYPVNDLITPNNSYNINEIIDKYKISSSALYSIIQRLEIPKKNYGKHVLVKKEDIDKIFA
jgi:excisionase family DNA binding protein